MRGKAQRESARRAASPDFYRKWMLTIARPPQSHEASTCQVSAQSSDPRLSYCDFTDFPKRGLNSATDLFVDIGPSSVLHAIKCI